LTGFRLALTIKWKTSNPTRKLTTIQNKVFAYARVSTQKQGERGVSLQEQREAIKRYAERTGLVICEWFEERETAAKRGRPVFATMMSRLRKGVARGVIIHKIDRSARNLRDWADLGELIDRGIQVHFANESLDLHSRGGRLSADIQAVIAADYIRNLREEVRKGFYGRLKQGLYPLPAPLGYIDMGAGKPKKLNPKSAPLVRKAFKLYASGQHSLRTLAEMLNSSGLRTRSGRPITHTALSLIFNNPFYTGVIRIRRTNESFDGAHEPLVSKALFERVQAILSGRIPARIRRHDFTFKRLIRCGHCQRTLTGEIQKGHSYYRCHTKDCATKTLREEAIIMAFREAFGPLRLRRDEISYLASKIDALKKDGEEAREAEVRAYELQLASVDDRLRRLTDAFIDGLIDKDVFDERNGSLLLERKGLRESLANAGSAPIAENAQKLFELLKSVCFLYESADLEEIRNLVQILTSNRIVKDGKLLVTLSPPFNHIARREDVAHGGPYRDRIRTWEKWLWPLLTTTALASRGDGARRFMVKS